MRRLAEPILLPRARTFEGAAALPGLARGRALIECGLHVDAQVLDALVERLASLPLQESQAEFGDEKGTTGEFSLVAERAHKFVRVGGVTTVAGGDDSSDPLSRRNYRGQRLATGHRMSPGVCARAFSKRDWTSAQLTMFHHCLTKVALSFLYCR